MILRIAEFLASPKGVYKGKGCIKAVRKPHGQLSDLSAVTLAYLNLQVTCMGLFKKMSFVIYPYWKDILT